MTFDPFIVFLPLWLIVNYNMTWICIDTSALNTTIAFKSAKCHYQIKLRVFFFFFFLIFFITMIADMEVNIRFQWSFKRHSRCGDKQCWYNHWTTIFFKHVFIAERKNANQDILYLSAKIPKGIPFLIELTLVIGVRGLKCAVKTPSPKMAPLFFKALETILKS